jgi:hypothetical protein
VLSQADWDPTIFSAFGEEAIPTREYAEDRLGEVFLRPEQGHDGKFFFVQSNDPMVLDPEENAAVLDRPLYRSQRMLYPMISGVGGALGPEAITWSMLIVNVLAISVGTAVVAMIAMEMGGSPWWGLAFALNLGFISEMNISGAGIVAAAAAFGAVLALLKGRVGLAVLFLVLAALSREAMLIAAAGSAWWLWRRQEQRRNAVVVAVSPILAVGAWAVYLRARMGWEPGVSEVQEIGLPFVGFFQAFSAWLGDPVDLAVGVGMMILFFLFARRTLLSGHLIGWAFVGFALLGVVFTKQVWNSYFDITRAVAPLITAFVLLVFLDTGRAGADDIQRTSVRS